MGGVARSYFAQLAVHDIFHYFPLGDMRRAAEHGMGHVVQKPRSSAGLALTVSVKAHLVNAKSFRVSVLCMCGNIGGALCPHARNVASLMFSYCWVC